MSEEQNAETIIGDVRIKHKSLKSRPGALRKMEALITMEKDRFNKNMAQMMQSNNAKDNAESQNKECNTNHETGKRWAAIRGFIQQTMERRPELAKGQER